MMNHTIDWRLFTAVAGLALCVAAPARGKLEITTKDGKYKARLAGRVQTRLTFEQPGGDEDTAMSFSIPRARLKVGGTAFTEGLGYKLQVDFGKGKAGLKDFYVEYFTGPSFGVRIGQMKMPFSRQQLTSSGDQAFVDRALTDKAFGAGRDIGVYLLSDYTKSNLEWAFGLFNGTGDNVVVSQFGPTLVGRIGWHSDGMDGYSEADLQGGAFRWAVAANAKLNLDMKTEQARDESVQSGVDFAFKAHGFSATGGVYLGMAAPKLGDLELDAIGAHVQAGWVFGGIYAPSVRWATLIPDGDGNDQMEIEGAFSIYLFGSHSLKWQTDVTAIVPEEGDTDLRARTQVQLAF